MFKFVLIGVLVVGFLSFVLWNLWKMVLLKHKYFSESETFLSFLDQFKDAPTKLKSIKADKIKTWLVGGGVSLLIVLVALAYFLIARNVFINNHSHSYQDRVTAQPTCITEGIREYKCRYCDEKYEEAISVIEHNHLESSRVTSTCVQEGKIEYTCEMCGDVKTEAIPVIAHNHLESNRMDSTCAQEGTIEYTCEMCGDIKTETISLKEHEYIQTVEAEATCTTEGVLATQCKNCDLVEKEAIPINDVHNFGTLSFTPSSFWENGYNHYACQDCGYETYSLSAKAFNWVIALAIVVFLIAFITIVVVRVDEGFWGDTFGRPLFWFAFICIIPSIILMILHWGVVLPHQEANKPIFQNMTKAPVECLLIEQEKVESSYTQNGTVLYKCQNCNKEYTEYLPLKELDVEQILTYTEPVITECSESEKNGGFSIANELPMYTKITGKLSSQKDIDFYKVTLLADGTIRFKFTHEADRYSNHWYVTIYDLDASTVLEEGYIDKDTDEFGCSDLPAGTYYLKISVISGGNPIMNNYSDADYHLVFAPECTEHTEITQYLSETPECLKPVEITTVCNCCGAVVSVETTKALEHRWGEWEIPESSSAESSGEKIRTCALCNETQTGKASEN